MNAFYTHSVCYFPSRIAEFLFISPVGGGASPHQLHRGGPWPIAIKPPQPLNQQKGKVLAYWPDRSSYKLQKPSY